MAKERFRVTWEAEDGYVGGIRPHQFHISTEEIEGLDERSLRELFWHSVRDDFEQKVNPISRDEERFIEWAKQKIAGVEK